MKDINEYIHSSRCIEDPVFQQQMLNKTYQNNINYFPYIYNNNIEQLNIHTQKYKIKTDNNTCNGVNVDNDKKQHNIKCYPHENYNLQIIKNQQFCLLKPQKNEKQIENNSKSLKTIDISKQNKIKKNKKKPLIIDKNVVAPMVQYNEAFKNPGIRSIPTCLDKVKYSDSLKIKSNCNYYNNNNFNKYSCSNVCYFKDQQYCTNSSLNTTKFEGNYIQSIQNSNIPNYIINQDYNKAIISDLNNSYSNTNTSTNSTTSTSTTTNNITITNNNEYMQSLIQFGCFNANCNFMGASQQYLNNMEYYNKINGMLDYDNEELIKQFDEDMKKINSKFLLMFCIDMYNIIFVIYLII